jgi:hypothetical protein
MKIIEEIRRFISLHIRPFTQSIGIDIETADYLITTLSDHTKQLSNTRSALFTLANLHPHSRMFIAGSKKIFEEMTRFKNEVLASHYATLLIKNFPRVLYQEDTIYAQNLLSINLSRNMFEKYIQQILEEDAEKKEEGEKAKIKKKEILLQLNRIACLELYLGNNPYKGKETLQTIIRKFSLEQERESREAPFSIKFCISRFADMYYAACLSELGNLRHLKLDEKVPLLERLGAILSNIICRSNARRADKDPASLLHENASDLTIEHIQEMTAEDKAIMKELLGNPLLGEWCVLLPVIDSPLFANQCYGALWKLADRLLESAKNIEDCIYRETEESGILQFLPARKYLIRPFPFKFFEECRQLFFGPKAPQNLLMAGNREKLLQLENQLTRFAQRINLQKDCLAVENVQEMNRSEQTDMITILSSLLVDEWKIKLPQVGAENFALKFFQALHHLAAKIAELAKETIQK